MDIYEATRKACINAQREGHYHALRASQLARANRFRGPDLTAASEHQEAAAYWHNEAWIRLERLI